MSTLFKLHQVNVWQEEVRKTQDVCSLHKEFYGQKYVLTMSGDFLFLCVFSRLDELNTTRATFKERARELEEEIAVLRSRTNSTQQVSFWTNYPCSCGKDVNKFCWLYPIALRVQVDHSSTMVINQKMGMGNWVSTRSGCQRGSQSFWTTNGEFGFPCSCRWRSSGHHCLQVLKDLLQWRIHETICFNNWNIL